jgi:hypothetical protein
MKFLCVLLLGLPAVNLAAQSSNSGQVQLRAVVQPIFKMSPSLRELKFSNGQAEIQRVSDREFQLRIAIVGDGMPSTIQVIVDIETNVPGFLLSASLLEGKTGGSVRAVADKGTYRITSRAKPLDAGKTTFGMGWVAPNARPGACTVKLELELKAAPVGERKKVTISFVVSNAR